MGVWAAIGGAALPAGPLIGGLLVQTAGWRAVFWLSVPVIALALVPVLRLPGSGAGRRRDDPVDWGGAGLLVAGLACLVTAIIQGPDLPWLGVPLGVIAVGLAAWFVSVERRTAHPLLSIPHRTRGALAAACAVAGLMNLCVLGALFLLTQLFQDVHSFDPLTAGLSTLPAMLPLPLLGAPSGRLTARIGVWHTSALGLLVSAIGFAGIACTAGGSNVALLFCLAVWGAGLGILTPAIVTAALRAAPGSPGAASGVSNTSRQTGGALGVAIFAAIAGPADGLGFVSHSLALFLAGSAAFAVASMLCFAAARRRLWR